jgi:hypothetical protein
MCLPIDNRFSPRDLSAYSRVMPRELPDALVRRVLTNSTDAISEIREEPLSGGTGAASGSLTRLHLEIRDEGGKKESIRLIRKVLRPLTEGRHAARSQDPRHWAYWRREAEAYNSGLLPCGPGLTAPTCFAVDDDTIYLQEVAGPAPSPDQAARHLAMWQTSFDPVLDRQWLARGQLRQRLEVSQLSWDDHRVDRAVAGLWERRWELLEMIERLPLVRSHGDYSIGNLVSQGADTVALDWATVGWEPLGFDLAHLALSSGTDPRSAYREAAPSEWREDLDTGFTAATAIIGSSRMHWMLSSGYPVPSWYERFLIERQPT